MRDKRQLMIRTRRIDKLKWRWFVKDFWHQTISTGVISGGAKRAINLAQCEATRIKEGCAAYR